MSVKHYKMHGKHLVLLNLQYFSNLRDFENKHKKSGGCKLRKNLLPLQKIKSKKSLKLLIVSSKVA